MMIFIIGLTCSIYSYPVKVVVVVVIILVVVLINCFNFMILSFYAIANKNKYS